MSNMPTILAVVFVAALLWCLIVAWGQPKPYRYCSRFEEIIPNCTLSPDQFYALVFDELAALFSVTQLPFSAVSFGPRELYSGRHVFSPRCVYLEVKYEQYSYYIYAVPAGDMLCVTGWLFSKYDAWMEYPVLRQLALFQMAGETLFRVDIMSIFHSVVAGALYTVLNDLREKEGLRPLAEYERRPVLRGYYARLKQGDTPAAMVAPPVTPVPQPAVLPSQPPVLPAVQAQPATGQAPPMEPSGDALADTRPLLLEQRPGTGSLGDLTSPSEETETDEPTSTKI